MGFNLCYPLYIQETLPRGSHLFCRALSPHFRTAPKHFSGGDLLESGALSILGTESDSASPAALTPGSPFPPQACICTSLFLSACLNSIAFIFFKGLVRECLLDGDKSVVWAAFLINQIIFVDADSYRKQNVPWICIICFVCTLLLVSHTVIRNFNAHSG